MDKKNREKWSPGGKTMVKVFLVEDEAIIRRGIRDNIDWASHGFEFAERHRTEKKRWNSWKNITRIW